MTIKKITWMFFALFISFISITFSNNTYADNYFTDAVEAEGQDCGAMGSGDLVAPKSFSICKEDLAYNILYMSFSKVFNTFNILKAFVFEDAGSLDLSGYANDMGGAILAVILGVTQIVFIIGGITIGLVTIKVIYKSMTSGDFLGKGVNKVWLVLRTLGIIFLIFPIDSTVSLSQLIVIMLALLSIMGGNFFYGLFLSVQQQQALVAEENFTENYEKSLGQAEAMVQMSLCQTRTIKAIRTKNFKDYDDGIFTDLNFSSQLKRISNCIAPETYFTYPSENIGGTGSKYGNVEAVKFTKKEVCEGIGGTSALSEYDPKYHGYPFSCGTITFSHPDIGKEANSASGQNDANTTLNILSTTRTAIDTYIGSGLTAFNSPEKLSTIEGLVAKIKSGEQFDWKELDSLIQSSSTSLVSAGTELYTTVKQATDHNTAVKTLFVANSILLNNLLGAKSSGGEAIPTGTDVAKALLLPGGVASLASSEIAKLMQDKYAAHSTDMITLLSKYSVNASSRLDEAHCLNNFSNVFKDTKKSYESLVNNTETDFEDFIKQGGVYFGECLWFKPSNELNARYDTTGGTGIENSKLKLTFGSSEANNLILNYNDKNNRQALNKMRDENYPKLLLQAQADKMTLAGYFYVARGTIKKSMLEVLDKNTDKELPKKMRKMGFASFGGFILQMSADQTNANRYMKQINSGVKWSSHSEDAGNGYYINEDVFGNADENQNVISSLKFKKMTLGNYFLAGENTNTIVTGAATGGDSTVEDEDSMSIKAIFNWLEDSLTSPLVYLKKMGGTDLNLPLREGVAKCFRESNCYPGEIHPVNALSYMGVDLIDTSINFFLLHATLAILSTSLNSLDSGNGSIKKQNIVSQFANALFDKIPVVKIIKTTVKYAYGITKALSPIFSALFLMGIFFGYMLPIMPYAAYLIMLLGWLIFIFQLLFTVPIWLIMIAIPAPNGQPRGNVGLLWQYTLLLLLKPSLMVIGLIIAWFFSIVSVFFINMTLFGALGPVFEASNGEYIMKFVDVIMFYFVYLVVVFVALKHSFSIISSFPDSAAKALELRGYDDSRTISSVGAEQLLGLMIVNRVKDSISSAFKTALLEYQNDPEKYRKASLQEARDTATRHLSSTTQQMSTSEQDNKKFNSEEGEKEPGLLDEILDVVKDPKGDKNKK